MGAAVGCNAATLPNASALHKRGCFCMLPAMSDEFPEFLDPCEDCEWMTARDLLARQGFVSPAPETVEDADVRGRLWELLYALAARRIYFSGTDHLSDREFYVWLHEHWLPEETADIPPEAEINTRVDASGSDSGSDTWLKYYATEDIRREFQVEFPDDPMPPHEDPPHDRDRWMPEPPLPETGVEAGDEADWMADENEEDDPLGLGAVDREIREGKARAAAESGSTAEDAPFLFPEPGMPSPEDRPSAELAACEPGDWRRPLDVLNRQGVVLPPPDELTDESLPAKVWELLHELACRGFYVLHSDHLSDRELYAALWKDSLREPAMLPGRCRNGGWFHDFTGSGSPEHTQLWLRYYATDEERARYAREEWFTGSMPPHEQPPHGRDWRLPKGPF